MEEGKLLICVLTGSQGRWSYSIDFAVYSKRYGVKTMNMKTNNNKNVAILFVSLVVVMLGFGMVIPIIPFYIEKLGASASQLGLLIALYSIMQFIFAPLWGNISDRIGRRPVLMIGMLGSGLAVLLFGLSTKLWMLFVSRILAGILSSAMLPATMAYIGDSTSEEERVRGMGIVGGASGLGVILGPGLGGWLAGESLSTPFFVATALSIVTLFLIFFFLPESLSPQDRKQSGSDLQILNVAQLWRGLLSPMGVLLFMAFLMSFGMTNFQGIFGLYALKKFGYGPEQVGTILMVIGFVYALGQGVLIGPLTKRFGESTVIKASLIASSAGFIFMLLAETYFMVLVTTGFFILAHALMRPAVSSLISKESTTGQGVAMGLNNSIMSLGRTVGPVWAGFIFDIDYNYPYLSGSFILLMGFVMSMFMLSRDPVKSSEQVDNQQHNN